MSKQISALNTYKKQVLNSEKICMIPNCGQPTIDSHLIQRSNFLAPIADVEGKLYKPSGPETYAGKAPYFFRQGAKSILTFQGFCAFHDQLVFAEIEKHPINLNDYKHLMLLNYRAVCHELRKKLSIYEWTSKFLSSETNLYEETRTHYKHHLFLQSLGIKDLEAYKMKIEDTLMNDIRHFEFIVKSLPYRELVTSSVFSMDNVAGHLPENIGLTPYQRDYVLPYVLFTVFPRNNELILIVGYLKEHQQAFTHFLEEMNLAELNVNFVNNILIEWIETWACSTSFYEKNIAPQRDAVLNAMYSIRVSIPVNQGNIPFIMS